MKEEEKEEDFSQSHIEPLIRKVFDCVKLDQKITKLGTAQVQWHPTHIEVEILRKKFKIQITEI